MIPLLLLRQFCHQTCCGARRIWGGRVLVARALLSRGSLPRIRRENLPRRLASPARRIGWETDELAAILFRPTLWSTHFTLA